MSFENLTFLEIVQEVFKEIRESKPTSLSIQSPRTQEVVQAVKDIYVEVCSLNNGHLSFLEADGEITLETGGHEYFLSTDTKDINLSGWVLDDAKELTYLDLNAFRTKYLDATQEGAPFDFTLWSNKVLIGHTPHSLYHGKKVTYKYWKRPNDLTNDADIPLIPAEFRRRILVFGAAGQLLQSDGDPSYKFFWDRYMGGIADLKRGYASIVPTKARVTHVF